MDAVLPPPPPLHWVEWHTVEAEVVPRLAAEVQLVVVAVVVEVPLAAVVVVTLVGTVVDDEVVLVVVERVVGEHDFFVLSSFFGVLFVEAGNVVGVPDEGQAPF